MHIPKQRYSRNIVKTTSSEGSKRRTQMYLRGPIKAFREQMSILGKTEYFIALSVPKRLRWDDSAFQSSPLQTSHVQSIWKYARQRVLSCMADKLSWKFCKPSLPGYIVLREIPSTIFWQDIYNLDHFGFFCVPDKCGSTQTNPSKKIIAHQ